MLKSYPTQIPAQSPLPAFHRDRFFGGTWFTPKSETFLAMERILLWPSTAPGPRDSNHAGCQPEQIDHRPYLTSLRRPSRAGLQPCIIVCPGGGYHGRAAHEGDPISERLAQMGVASCVLHYRVSPWRHPSALADGVRAIRILRHRAAEFGLDPERIGILGFSAGGHAAAHVATRHQDIGALVGDDIDRASGRPDLLVCCYAVLSCISDAHDGSWRNLLGPNATWNERRAASIEERINAQTPPTFFWSSDDDQAVPVINTYNVAQRLARHGVPHEVHVYERGQHGLGLGNVPGREDPHIAQWATALERWLARRGWI